MENNIDAFNSILGRNDDVIAELRYYRDSTEGLGSSDVLYCRLCDRTSTAKQDLHLTFKGVSNLEVKDLSIIQIVKFSIVEVKSWQLETANFKVVDDESNVVELLCTGFSFTVGNDH